MAVGRIRPAKGGEARAPATGSRGAITTSAKQQPRSNRMPGTDCRLLGPTATQPGRANRHTHGEPRTHQWLPSAVGAGPKDVSWLVLREVVQMSGIGLAIGLVIAFGLGLLIQSQLYGVKASEPIVIAAATIRFPASRYLQAGCPRRFRGAVNFELRLVSRTQSRTFCGNGRASSAPISGEGSAFVSKPLNSGTRNCVSLD